jgi:LEA14-like dessication related protein
MNRVAARLTLIVALLVGLSSCSAFRPELEPPRLALIHIAMTNKQELKIKGLDYTLFLEGDGFAEGLLNKPFTIPAEGETDFDMTVKTNFVSGIGRLLSRLNGRTQVNYSVEGKLLTDIRFLKKIPFQETGSVNLAVLR